MSNESRTAKPNAAMICLLEVMRDNPGAVSPYAGAGAACWALGEIGRLRAALKPLAGIVDCVDRPGSMRLSDDTGLWTQGDNANGDYRLTLGHARRAKEIING